MRKHWEQSHPIILDELNCYAGEKLIPLHCQFELTYACGPRCRHCYLASETARPAEELTTDAIKTFFDELAELGGFFLTFTGGEPFLRPDIEELFQHARKRRFAVSFLTSGWGVDKKLLERMVHQGLDSAQVSIHGPDAESHEAFTRKAGSFESAWRTLMALKDFGVPVRAALNLHRENLQQLDDMVCLLDEVGVPYNLNLNMMPRRDGDRTPQRLQLDEEQIRQVLKKTPLRKRFRMAKLLPNDPPCRAGRSTFSVDPYGVMHPCIIWRKPLGLLKEQSFGEIWRNSRGLSSVREMRLDQLEDCPACKMRESCNRCTGLAVLEGMNCREHSMLDCIQADIYNLTDDK